MTVGFHGGKAGKATWAGLADHRSVNLGLPANGFRPEAVRRVPAESAPSNCTNSAGFTAEASNFDHGLSPLLPTIFSCPCTDD